MVPKFKRLEVDARFPKFSAVCLNPTVTKFGSVCLNPTVTKFGSVCLNPAVPECGSFSSITPAVVRELERLGFDAPSLSWPPTPPNNTIIPAHRSAPYCKRAI